MKKTFYLLGIILLITGFFASCGKNKPVDDEKIIIAVIPKIDN